MIVTTIEDIVDGFKPEDETDHFTDSRFEWIWKMANASKGEIGERLIARVRNGTRVTDVEEYDVVVGSEKHEVKLACLRARGTYAWNQIRLDYDYTHLSLIAVNPEVIRIFIVPKNEIPEDRLNRQHGGKNTDGDNYVYESKKRNWPPDWMLKYEFTL